MKVLQISNYIHPHIGGIEMTARAILDALKTREDIEQQVFCFNSDALRSSFDVLDGVKVTRIGVFTKIASQALGSTYGRRLKGTFKEFNPDVVIFHYPNPFCASYLLKLLKKNPQCKLIMWWHLDITKQKMLGKLFEKQSIQLLERAERVIATSPNYIAGSKFLSKYENKCTVIPSCMGNVPEITEEIKEKVALIRRENEGKTVCFAVGRHVEYKGLTYLIKASKCLGDDYTVYIGGSGKLTKKLKREAASDKKVIFLGKLPYDDLVAYMLACDVYCFPSITKNEAFGLSLAEAMYAGKPSVTFTIEGSGVNYVSLNGKTCIEVENRNVEQYAEAIKKLASDNELREKMGKAARERAEENFTYEIFADRVLKVMETV